MTKLEKQISGSQGLGMVGEGHSCDYKEVYKTNLWGEGIVLYFNWSGGCVNLHKW
jgi:hypothetical protein